MIHPVNINSDGKLLNMDRLSEFMKWMAEISRMMQNQPDINMMYTNIIKKERIEY